MKTRNLIITGIIGVVLSFFVITGFLVLVVAPLNNQQIADYQSNELVKQFLVVINFRLFRALDKAEFPGRIHQYTGMTRLTGQVPG